MLYNGVVFGMYVASVYKDTALGLIPDSTLTLAGSLGAFANGGSRMFWATIMDYIGFRKVYLILVSIQIITATFIYQSRYNAPLYVMFVVLAFLCEGGHFSTFSAAAPKIFGLVDGGKVATFIIVATVPATLTGLVCTQFPNIFSPEIIFWVGAGLSVVNLILLFFLDESPMELDEDNKPMPYKTSWYIECFRKDRSEEKSVDLAEVIHTETKEHKNLGAYEIANSDETTAREVMTPSNESGMN